MGEKYRYNKRVFLLQWLLWSSSLVENYKLPRQVFIVTVVYSDLISTEAIVELEVNGRLGYRFPTYFFICIVGSAGHSRSMTLPYTHTV